MTDEKANRFYELGFLLTPNTPETEISNEIDKLKDLIKKSDGSIHSEGEPEFIDLAYQMEKTVSGKKNKWNQAYFGWVKFETSPDSLLTIKKDLDGVDSLIRYILIKTNIENTIIFKKTKSDVKRDVYLSEDEMNALIEETENTDEDEDEHEKLPSLDIQEDAEQDTEEKVEK